MSRISSRHCSWRSAGQTIEDAARAVAKEQLLRDQPGLDRLAETDVVGDQQDDARHPDRADERVELVPSISMPLWNGAR